MKEYVYNYITSKTKLLNQEHGEMTKKNIELLSNVNQLEQHVDIIT